MILIWSYVASNLVPIYSSIWSFDFQAQFSKVLMHMYSWNNIIENSKNDLKHMDTSSKLHDFAPTSWIYNVNDVEVSVWTWKSCPRCEFGSFISFVSIPKHVHKFRIQNIFPYNLIMYHVSKGWLIILWMITFSLVWRRWYVSVFYFCDNVRLVT
jgi:hypothetical protein